jgi:4-diphosphocytidyl-2-C-methyl-D-erythritol kinase
MGHHNLVPWIVSCPAKLNLFLSVGPVDRRGYHPIRSIFQAVSIFDTLTIELADEDLVVAPDLPPENTVSRTLRLLKEVVALPPLKVVVDKQIPVESGLGGGSSDAAGLIRAAKVISKMPIPEAELLGLAQTIGADVPFFLLGGRAKAEGYGEKLTPLPDAPAFHCVVAKPAVGCASGAAYGKLDEKSFAFMGFPEDDELYNDFERVAPCESLELIDRMLALGANGAGLTGSGSAVFGLFDNPLAAYSRLFDEGYSAWVARSLTRSESLEIQLV